DSQLEDVLCQIHSNGRSIHGTDSFRFVSADTTPMRPAGTMMPNTDREETIPSLQRAGTHKVLTHGPIKCWRAGAHHHFLGGRCAPARCANRGWPAAELGS